jgi:hypothetical protein
VLETARDCGVENARSELRSNLVGPFERLCDLECRGPESGTPTGAFPELDVTWDTLAMTSCATRRIVKGLTASMSITIRFDRTLPSVVRGRLFPRDEFDIVAIFDTMTGPCRWW